MPIVPCSDRVDLDLGRSARDEMSINERLHAFQEDQNDPSLGALYFQFGRYLLISSTQYRFIAS